MKDKKILYLGFILALSFSIPFNASAMHIAEGYLSLNWCVFYFILSAPFIYLSVIAIRKVVKKNSELKMLLGLIGAYVFMLSALKLPSVTGSSSHPTGTGLGAIVFGPIVMVVISLVVLLFQALLLAHGGITTLGANVVSMGIVGPFVAYGIFRLFKNKNKTLAVFLAATLGDLATYVVTSGQLALAYPSGDGGVLTSFIKFAGIFAITQIPLAIVEGLVSVMIYEFIMKHCKSELVDLEEALI
ncbi:energy-coupling factor ABC transporter permease [Clostridium gasigenes]|uniref:Cobalt transport protein CbiM n=1 Tax=Clostridium gasigenes TaxID=94869 RepID=A0A1H0U4X6_9CLOT|nr:energy-coupling factor ABC transporter permease [Clostridium gasigenes]MBB6622854.1 energy-coupling factor ABC transporter permease [Clostridium gasigenes]MBB6714465.1 energy-coupling factor ABC transporter permease [Clostridium gasigenes]MBU3089378.1 energy-coupling factor ABC transporter permease [Clostridium gasigenes]MBU3103612.1 energy-coupling factor ABC transporter permease [Clostridium gasigenes]MBU3108437.1 energy-coupling factor ABC transporter permease [Clostridium gasigenes]